MTKLEEVARAIEDTLAGHRDVVMGVGSDVAISAARAAMQALRQPGWQVFEAMENSHVGPDRWKFSWDAAIDTILNEKPDATGN